MFVRELFSGMGQAVAERTVLRKKDDQTLETWGDVAHRVALGNSMLCICEDEKESEYNILRKHISKASLLMSGRHLQHGDETQPTRNSECFTNCATSPTSFMLFYLLMSGSGVGRCYDDDMMVVDWNYAPDIRCVLDESHPDFNYLHHESVREAKHKYDLTSEKIHWIDIQDSREGWSKAVEIWERMAFAKTYKDHLLILNFSPIRGFGSPIKGMQNRPASGPAPLMHAFEKSASLKGGNLSPWKQTIYIDHYFAECVLVGGARRAARMATKTWRDKTVLDFINIKRPIEYSNKSFEEINRIKKEQNPSAFLWSANNSITVDEEFWKLVNGNDDSELAKHARLVFEASSKAAYGDGTGEPGFINEDKLNHNREGFDDLVNGNYMGSKLYPVDKETQDLVKAVALVVYKKKDWMIVNPCGEIALNILGGFCVIADVVPYHADSIEEAEEAFAVATRSLIRVNTMDSVYNKEVRRTNRIGVGLTGIHEFAWKFFGYGFYDLINEEKSKDFWMTLSKFNRIVRNTAKEYCIKYGLNYPHTLTTIKPSGTVSKLFGLTEGWHLPAMAWYLRWVQFSSHDPLVLQYINEGYPYRELKQYKNTTIIGFPTKLAISELGMDEKLVTAYQATPEEQYKWVALGEKYWIEGVDEQGNSLEPRSNQISYTLKYNPKVVSYDNFKGMILKYQPTIRCCSVMPQEDHSAYEYLPEEAISYLEYQSILGRIGKKLVEDVDKVHVDCAGGACPVDFRK